MSMKRALQAILTVAVIGLAFSGVLAYREFFGAGSIGRCPSPGAPGTVFGYPACVYGFFMYLLITGLATAGLRAKQ
jgi:ABC-type tungstate transport system substrate-binding protein